MYSETAKEHFSNPPDTGVMGEGNLRSSLAAEVKERSGVELSRCYHCRSCGNGCPFAPMITRGGSSAIWWTRVR